MDLAGPSQSAGYLAQWSVSTVSSVAWQELDGELVVYLEEAGSTHLLGAYAGATLLTLLEENPPLNLNDLVTRLQGAGEKSDTHDTGGSSSDLIGVLAEFERIGLIRRS